MNEVLRRLQGPDEDRGDRRWRRLTEGVDMEWPHGTLGLALPIYLTRREFEALPEYSTSVPTGQTIGKRWRKSVFWHLDPTWDQYWVMGEYIDWPVKGQIGIRWRRILPSTKLRTSAEITRGQV